MEIGKLVDFYSKSVSRRSFTGDSEAAEILDDILSKLCTPEQQSLSEGDKLVTYQSLKLLLRDKDMMLRLETATKVIPVLCEEYVNLTQRYLHKTNNSHESSEVLFGIMTELTNIFQKLSTNRLWHESLIDAECHTQMMSLLSCSSDQPIFQSSLVSLVNLSKEPKGREAVLELCPLYTVIDIISNYDTTARLMASDLFILLSLDSNSQQQIKDFDLLPCCVMLVQSIQPEKVKQKVFKALQKILLDEELLEEFRNSGGIPILVKTVSDIDRSHYEYLHSTLHLICTLCVYDPCSKQIADCNGIYFVARYLVGGAVTDDQQKVNLDVLRALRYLFSLESNRRLLKRLFPTHIFEAFIDIGHYVFPLDKYDDLCALLESLSQDEIESLKESIASLDKTKEPVGSIGGYLLLEVLGRGAYGVVYRVTKGTSGSFYAMKEISLSHPALGGTTAQGGNRSMKDRAEKTERIVSEVAMTQKNLSHPNVVKFHKCFQESQHIYIVMSLIDGASLNDHITSLKEKSQVFTEKRIWKIFTQLTLGLRYLHEEKHIVHRDLKPANIMLGEKDKVTITDFGLAKEHNEFSVMKSVVGTMLYWSPELVQNEPYDKKVDIWAAGCVLYEMAVLSPPFSSGNMLTLAKKIAEVDYDTDPLHTYSPLLGEVVNRCLNLDPNARPDAIQIGGLIVEHVMDHLDTAIVQFENMERKLTREKEKSLRHKQELLTSASKQSSSRQPPSLSRRRLSYSPIRMPSHTMTSQQQKGDLNHPPSHHVLDTGSDMDLSSVGDSTTIPLHSISSVIPTTAVNGTSSSMIVRRASSPSPLHRSSVTAATPRSPLLSLSSSHLKEVVDPVGSLMTQIHKLIYISQLPPSPKPSSCYLIVLQYKKTLFKDESKAIDFKSEIQKLSTSSTQPVVCFPPSSRLLSQAIKELRASVTSNYAPPEEVTAGGILTYELLYGFIEDILGKTGYYGNQVVEGLSSDNC